MRLSSIPAWELAWVVAFWNHAPSDSTVRAPSAVCTTTRRTGAEPRALLNGERITRGALLRAWGQGPLRDGAAWQHGGERAGEGWPSPADGGQGVSAGRSWASGG